MRPPLTPLATRAGNTNGLDNLRVVTPLSTTLNVWTPQADTTVMEYFLQPATQTVEN